MKAVCEKHHLAYDVMEGCPDCNASRTVVQVPRCKTALAVGFHEKFSAEQLARIDKYLSECHGLPLDQAYLRKIQEDRRLQEFYGVTPQEVQRKQELRKAAKVARFSGSEFYQSVLGKPYFSPEFLLDTPQKPQAFIDHNEQLRYLSVDFGHKEVTAFYGIHDEIALRVSPGQAKEIKQKFLYTYGELKKFVAERPLPLISTTPSAATTWADTYKKLAGDMETWPSPPDATEEQRADMLALASVLREDELIDYPVRQDLLSTPKDKKLVVRKVPRVALQVTSSGMSYCNKHYKAYPTVTGCKDCDPDPVEDQPDPSLVGECAYCGAHAKGNYAIHRDGFGEGPEVPLCDACGGCDETVLSCEQIWDRISQDRSLL